MSAENQFEFKVLDKGYIKLIDIMGDDLSAIRAARVSYGKEISEPERDRKLIMYLMEHDHQSPFEHIVYTFYVKTPIFVARQWLRHRIGSFNEISRRYTSKWTEEFYVPSKMRIQAEDNKQSSHIINNDELDKECIGLINEAYDKSFEIYESLLEKGVAREMARMVLPVGQYTQFYWTVNARALMNFINLRADSHAQLEIQEYAEALVKIFKETCPWTYEAFLKYEYKGDLVKE